MEKEREVRKMIRIATQLFFCSPNSGVETRGDPCAGGAFSIRDFIQTIQLGSNSSTPSFSPFRFKCWISTVRDVNSTLELLTVSRARSHDILTHVTFVCEPGEGPNNPTLPCSGVALTNLSGWTQPDRSNLYIRNLSLPSQN